MATDNKYDRQLRLWGPHGQRNLMESNILLVNADAAGTETLKNLVLPGVGRFTVADDQIVSEADLGTNFFVTANDLGKSRAEVVTKLLCELNPDVTGIAQNGNIQECCNEIFIKNFTLIILVNIPEILFLSLSKLCWQHNIPIILIKSYGLIGSCRIQLNNHNIIESKPDEGESRKPDLRISKPFIQLQNFTDSIDFSTLDGHALVHLPYIIILLKLLQEWCQMRNNGNLPTTFAEKGAFKQYVSEIANTMKSAKGLKSSDGENWSEAIDNAYLAHYKGDLPWEAEGVMQRLNNPEFKPNSDFDVMLCALKRFQNSHDNALPLSGIIPDVTASTTYFQNLQKAYHDKANEDRKKFNEYINEVINEYGLSPGLDGSPIVNDSAIELFCKNVRNIRSVTTRSLDDERTNPAADAITEAIFEPDVAEDPKQNPILWYLALRGADRFYTNHGRYPGTGDMIRDRDDLWELIQVISNEYLPSEGEVLADGLEGVLTIDHATEVTRYGACELHNVAALIGGVASQEAVKIITHQYMPLNNTFIYNGVASIGYRFEA